SSSGQLDLETVWVSDSAFTSTVPAGTGAGKDLSISVLSQVYTRPQAFSYALPLIATLSEPVATTTGGGPKTLISGANFGTLNPSPSARAGWTAFRETIWESDEAVRGRVAPGVGINLDVVLEVDGQHGTKVAGMRYTAPTLTHVAHTDAIATTGQATLTLLGLNFGTFDSSVSGRVDGSLCVSAQWISDTALSCLAGAGTGGSLVAAAHVASQVGTRNNAVGYAIPAVTALAPYTGPTSGGFSVTVSGASFGTYDSTPSVALGSSLCSSVSYVSDTSLACQAVVGMGGGLSVVVEVDGQRHTEAQVFSYYAPNVTAASPDHGPTAGGSSITILGSSFGQQQAGAQVAFVGHSQCSQSIWTSDSSLRCVGPPGGGSELGVRVEVLGNTGTLLSGFCYDAPTIESAFPGVGPATGGGIMTIVGQSFGAAVGMSAVLVRVGGTACASTTYGSNVFMLNCVVPAGSGVRLPVSVSVDGQESTMINAYTYTPPVLHGLAPAHALASGGQSITVLGSSFGVATDSQVITFGGTSALFTNWVSDSSMVVSAAAGVGDTKTLAFSTRGQWHSLDRAFSFSPPQMTAFSPPNVQVHGGVFTVLGYSLGTSDYSAAVKVSADQDQLRMGSACESSEWTSDSSVACRSASGGGSLVTVSATVAMQHTTKRPGLSFDLPLVTSSAPLNFGQTGGSVVTLFGVNFAPNDYSTKARLGKTGCVSTQWTSESSIECGVPAGTTAVSMSLTVFKKTGTSFLVFSYNQPEITHVTLRNVPTVTSATISIFGSAYGVWDTGAVVGYIGVSTCESTTWRSDSTIQCLLRHGISPGQEVSIGLETTKSIMPAYFTYDATVFTDVGRSNMPPQQQVERGLSGRNYGSASYSPRAAVGRSGCAASMWTSDTSLACTTST
ncbi:MAG: IPT/TIG domain-containing protein, partial [Promethearchaeia archaeon]